jgi:hypothetical protein
MATFCTPGPALTISQGTDAIPPQTGAATSSPSFRRRGARSFNRQDMERMYLKDNKLITVIDKFLAAHLARIRSNRH